MRKAALGLLVVVATLAVACQTATLSQAPDTSERAGESAEETAEQTHAPTVVPTPSPTPSPTEFGVGDTITISKGGDPWANFTVVEVQQATEYPDPDGYYTDEPQIQGNVFLAAFVRFDALTDGVDYNTFSFQVFVDNLAVDNFAFVLNGPEPTLSSGTLPAGRSAEGWLLYEVPASGKVLLSYSDFFNDTPIFEVVLREG